MYRQRITSLGSLSRSSEGSVEYQDLLKNVDIEEQIYQRGRGGDSYTYNRTYTPQSLAMRFVVSNLLVSEEKLFNVFTPPPISKFYSGIRQSLRVILQMAVGQEIAITRESESMMKSILPVLDSASPLILRPNIFNLDPSNLNDLYAGFNRLALEVDVIRPIYTTNPGKFMKQSECEGIENFQSDLNTLYLSEILSLSSLTSQKLTGSVCVEHPFNLARLYCGKCNRTVCVLCCLKVVGKHSHHIVTKKTNMNRTRAEIILRMTAILNDLIQISITTIDAPLHIQLFVHFFGMPLFDTSKLKMVSTNMVTLLGILNWFITYTNMMTVGPPNTMDEFANILQNFSTLFNSVLAQA